MRVAAVPRSVPTRPLGEDLLTLQQGADLCAVDYETFRRWIAKGVIPHVRVGPFHVKRVYRKDVEQLITPS